jgi:maltose O-acetyltransferase
MTVTGKILRRLLQGQICLASRWRRRQFLWLEGPCHHRFSVARQNVFYVPVRSGGVGSLQIGRANYFGYREAYLLGSGEILLQPRSVDAEIVIGERNRFSNGVSLIANKRIEIGDGCQIGDLVVIYDSDFHEIAPATRNRSAGLTAPVRIGNNVWIGSRAMILKGVTIGDNSVVAAMSLVTGSVPPNCIVAGNPAKILRYIE